MELFIKPIRNYRTIAVTNGTCIKTCDAKKWGVNFTHVIGINLSFSIPEIFYARTMP